MKATGTLIITQRPINVALYEAKNVVWARIGKYFVDSGLSPNTAGKMASQYFDQNPGSELFCQFKFRDGSVPEWCVNIAKLPEFLNKRRNNSVTNVLWTLHDAWQTKRASAEPSIPLEEAAQKTKSKSVERRLKIQADSDLNISVNAFN